MGKFGCFVLVGLVTASLSWGQEGGYQFGKFDLDSDLYPSTSPSDIHDDWHLQAARLSGPANPNAAVDGWYVAENTPTVAAPEAAPLEPTEGGVSPLASESDEQLLHLSSDVEELLEWRKSVEKAEAKAAAKAALSPTVKVSGRFFLDNYNYSQNDASGTQVGNIDNDTQFRTIWLTMQGDVMENTSYRMWFNLTGGEVHILDMYLDFSDLPYIQNFRIGHFFEPFGMEQLTPNKYLTFMERSSAFNFGRNTGLMAHSDDADANWTYGLGVFIAENNDHPIDFQDDNSAVAVTGRVTWLPWYDEATDGRGIFHLGCGFSNRHVSDDTIRFRNRPESAAGPYVVDTGTINATGYNVLGLEAAYAYGPLCMQSEYHRAFVDDNANTNPEFDGFYFQTSYFLTGENRYYNRRSGSFSNRVVPIENFFRVRTGECSTCTGWGAWEVAYRFSMTDLTSATTVGGTEDLHSLGVNWYLSPYTRAMFDYIHSSSDTAAANDGVVNIFQMRLQYEF